jgi:hypothetical protein
MRRLRRVLLLIGAFLVGCVSLTPEGAKVWVTHENETRTFRSDRDFIRANCEFLKEEKSSEGPRTSRELRNYAGSIGANTIILEETEGFQQLKATLYRCSQRPAGVR